MKSTSHLHGCLIVATALLIGISAQAPAQDKRADNVLKNELKVLIDNDKVWVIEDKFKPGAESEPRARPYRVTRAITGGTLQRIYPDGRKETVQWKSGEVKFLEPSGAYKLKNIGKTEVLLFVVYMK